jgi:hypothetical protein
MRNMWQSPGNRLGIVYWAWLGQNMLKNMKIPTSGM